ncbi:MAG: electron transport complex subunit E, partial [Nitrospirales bacterium]|nr:electron transport complex subunit E [Nitrospirales bacterium]
MAQASTVNYWELIKNGLIKDNTIFKLALSLCPSIAVT